MGRAGKEDRFAGFFAGVGAMAMGAKTYEWAVEHEHLQAQSATVSAAVNEHPARLGADRDRDRLHVTGAVRLPVAGNVAVEVP